MSQISSMHSVSGGSLGEFPCKATESRLPLTSLSKKWSFCLKKNGCMRFSNLVSCLYVLRGTQCIQDRTGRARIRDRWPAAWESQAHAILRASTVLLTRPLKEAILSGSSPISDKCSQRPLEELDSIYPPDTHTTLVPT